MNLCCYLSILHCTLAKVGILVYSTYKQCDLLFTVHHFIHKIQIQLIQVWHVTLKLSDQTQKRRLSATFLSSFPHEYFGDLFSLSLGMLVTFGVEKSGQPCFYVAIFDWAKAVIHNPSHWHHVTSLSYPKKIIYDLSVS